MKDFPGADAATTGADVVIVGAGLSGIAAAHHLQARCPGRRFTILEARDAIGGTWDLFRYPGVRSDSDMATLGYSFRPWRGGAAFATGPQIREYVRETAAAEGIDAHIRFGHRVTQAEWDAGRARWTVSGERADGAQFRVDCSFLFFCSGYYDDEQGHAPDWPGRDRFEGRIVHPQHWPADLDVAGRRVVVIGSGATAVTLLPELAARGAQVTMLQRSPSYILPLPGRDSLGAALHRLLPATVAHRLVRWKNILMAAAFYQFSQRWPRAARRLIGAAATRQLGPGFDHARHLTPRYDPWDQRLCIAPDADFFAAVRSGRAAIVTDTISGFTPQGLRLGSGAELPADIVVTATGLRLRFLGGAALRVDGREVRPSDTVVYRGVMVSGVPNLAVALGYTNASWTLKCELAARFVCRVLNHMAAHGHEVCVPVHTGVPDSRPLIDLSSGYVQRSAAELPRQGRRMPWRMAQNYFQDLLSLTWTRLDDGALRFGRRAPPG